MMEDLLGQIGVCLLGEMVPRVPWRPPLARRGQHAGENLPPLLPSCGFEAGTGLRSLAS